jgi:hypothetical protein
VRLVAFPCTSDVVSLLDHVWTVLGLYSSSVEAAPQLECLFGSNPGPDQKTDLKLTKTNKYGGMIKKQWSLANDTSSVAMYSTAFARQTKLIIKPHSAPTKFRNLRVFLENAKKGYGAGQFVLTIPGNQTSCTIDLNQAGMDVSGVAVF